MTSESSVGHLISNMYYLTSVSNMCSRTFSPGLYVKHSGTLFFVLFGLQRFVDVVNIWDGIVATFALVEALHLASEGSHDNRAYRARTKRAAEVNLAQHVT